MTPKSELEQHSLNDLWEIQREMRADIKRLEESVRVLVSGLAQGKSKTSSADLNAARTWQAQLIEIESLKAKNYELKVGNSLLENRLRELSTDVERLLRENVALKIKLEETNGR